MEFSLHLHEVFIILSLLFILVSILLELINSQNKVTEHFPLSFSTSWFENVKVTSYNTIKFIHIFKLYSILEYKL